MPTRTDPTEATKAPSLACRPSLPEGERKRWDEVGVDLAATPDVATPDVATPDVATPDAATPDVATPDVATPDAATPDAATPEAERESTSAHAPSTSSLPHRGEMPGRAERGSGATEQADARLDPPTFRRALRHEATPAEKRLWTILRAGRLDGLKVRRQHAIGPYVVDFYCAAARLAIELDGSIHDDPARADADAYRERTLAARGVRTLRFSNADVLGQPEAVAAGVLEAARPA